MYNRSIVMVTWLLVVFIGFLSIPALVSAGGFWVVTLDDLPTAVVAEQPLTIGFMVRARGHEPLAELSPLITAVHTETKESLTVAAEEKGEVGHYVTTLLFPHAGSWEWSITMPDYNIFQGYPMPVLEVQIPVLASAPVAAETQPQFGPSILMTVGTLGMLAASFAWLRTRSRYALVLISLTAVGGTAGFLRHRNGTDTAVTTAFFSTEMQPIEDGMMAEWGQALFLAKGCTTCHRHAAIKRYDTVNSASASIGPNLTNYKGDPGFLHKWLSNPQAIRPRTIMPNLQLSGEEMEALIAFLGHNS